MWLSIYHFILLNHSWMLHLIWFDVYVISEEQISDLLLAFFCLSSISSGESKGCIFVSGWYYYIAIWFSILKKLNGSWNLNVSVAYVPCCCKISSVFMGLWLLMAWLVFPVLYVKSNWAVQIFLLPYHNCGCSDFFMLGCREPLFAVDEYNLLYCWLLGCAFLYAGLFMWSIWV